MGLWFQLYQGSIHVEAITLFLRHSKMCLRNRHGEDVVRAEASGIWVCPTCRGTCGEGCRLCCNCGPCRKKAGLAPTHQVIKEARAAGFDNVHDFLVWQSTGAW